MEQMRMRLKWQFTPPRYLYFSLFSSLDQGSWLTRALLTSIALHFDRGELVLNPTGVFSKKQFVVYDYSIVNIVGPNSQSRKLLHTNKLRCILWYRKHIYNSFHSCFRSTLWIMEYVSSPGIIASLWSLHTPLPVWWVREGRHSLVHTAKLHHQFKYWDVLWCFLLERESRTSESFFVQKKIMKKITKREIS